MTTDAAERLTARIRLRLDTIADNAEQVVPLIEQAKAGKAHQALGFPSWTAYVSERFGGTLGRLDRSERQPLVLLLAEQGMSTRAIGSVVSAGVATVHRDLAGVPAGTPGPVTGTDGKVYPRQAEPAAAKPRRRPLPEAYRDHGRTVLKNVESLGRLHHDDRFSANREAVLRDASQLARAANELLDLLDDLGVDRHKYSGVQ